MDNHVVRKCSMYRTEVVLKTKSYLYYYRMRFGISYFQNYNAIPNPTHPSIHDIISIRKPLKLCASTQTPTI
jgi:hypothetical protein